MVSLVAQEPADALAKKQSAETSASLSRTTALTVVLVTTLVLIGSPVQTDNVSAQTAVPLAVALASTFKKTTNTVDNATNPALRIANA